MAAAPGPTTFIFLELGAAIVGLALLARLANRWGFSAIPLYLLAGLAFGNGGLAPLHFTEDFIHIGGEIGVLLLLFMLGLEYTASELKENLRIGLPSSIVDFLLNFTPGLLAALWLGWRPVPAVLLGGVTWVSSSGVIAKVLAELQRLKNPETPAVLSILVLEDLAMAIYLPLVGVLLTGGTPAQIAVSDAVAVGAVLIILFLALRYGDRISRVAAHQSDEVVLLTAFGAILLVAGAAQRLGVSPAIAAFLVGIALSGPIAEQSHRLLAPLRDLFAATFFFFFGLEIDPSLLPKELPVAIGLGLVTAATKLLTGYGGARRGNLDRRARWRAGAALVARGEFSIVIAGLGVALEPRLGSLAAAYVLFLAILGPLLARAIK